MARDVSLGGVGKNPSIDQLTQANPAQFASAVKERLELKAIQPPNERAEALFGAPFAPAIARALGSESSGNDVIDYLRHRIRGSEARALLDRLEVQALIPAGENSGMGSLTRNGAKQ